jgi:hypothetical protein
MNNENENQDLANEATKTHNTTIALSRQSSYQKLL